MTKSDAFDGDDDEAGKSLLRESRLLGLAESAVPSAQRTCRTGQADSATAYSDVAPTSKAIAPS
jgi:hypothetical protein